MASASYVQVATTGARQRFDELTTGHQLGHHIQGVEPRGLQLNWLNENHSLKLL